MSQSSESPLRRRLLWSAAATLTLALLTSATSFPNAHQPERAFSLGLEQAFAAQYTLGLGDVPAVASSPKDAARFVVAAPGAWHLRPSEATEDVDSYVRALPFGREIDDAARRHEIDVLLLASVVEAESGFRADAVSEKGALGLMQLMPLHFEENAEPFDPELNLNLGAQYLESLRERYDGDVELALAAYHAGPGTVRRYGGAPPWKETRRYVDRVLTLWREHRAAAAANGASATTLGT